MVPSLRGAGGNPCAATPYAAQSKAAVRTRTPLCSALGKQPQWDGLRPESSSHVLLAKLSRFSELRPAGGMALHKQRSHSHRRTSARTLAPGVETTAAPTQSGLKYSYLIKKVHKFNDWLVNARRELHQCPELKFEEEQTSAALRRYLDQLNISYQYPIAKTGILATIGKGSPVVALRADMDALPIQELADVPFRSKVPGRMHACGHDSHMAMLLGGARLLKEMEGDLKGTVRVLFQPAEEGGCGGEMVVREGALEGVSAAFGMHVWPTLPSGVLATKAGVIMAGVLSFEATITGRGGHAAMPHLCVDPVVAAAATVGALQSLVSRETSPADSAVVSVTCLNAGAGAFNVIPDSATLKGTARALSESTMRRLRSRIQEVITAQAQVHGCSANVDFQDDTEPYFPPLINDAETSHFTREVARQVLGGEGVREATPTMGGEDFAFIANAVPACFAFLGSRNQLLGATASLHSPRFKLDEGVLPLGAAMHAAWALEYFERHGTAEGGEELA